MTGRLGTIGTMWLLVAGKTLKGKKPWKGLVVLVLLAAWTIDGDALVKL
jgi:hypothetical protein